MKILITAFEPFGNDTQNSSLELLKLLPENVEGKKISKLILPVVFDSCATILKKEVIKEDPDVIICLGQTGYEKNLCVEKVAINYKNARIPDNNDNSPIDEPISIGGETAYFSTLPIIDMVEASNKSDVSARVSYSAGTYVCNNLMYHILEMTDTSSKKAGFIHIPPFPSQKNDKTLPTMPTDVALKGLLSMINCL